MEERGGQQRLVMTLTIVNLALLVVLVVIGFMLYNSVRGAIDSVEDTIQTVETKVESVAGVVQDLDLPGAEDLGTLLDGIDLQGNGTADLEARLRALEAGIGRLNGGEAMPETADLEARLQSLEAGTGQPANGDVLFEIFPELRFDGMLSDGCADAMRSEVRRRFAGSSDFAEQRDILNGVDIWSSHPYSHLSNQMLYEIGNWVDAMAESRGWREWQGDGYRVYDRSYDEVGAGASGIPPCLSEREGVSVFMDIRNESPMSNFREDVVRNYWECVSRIREAEMEPTPTPYSYDESYVQSCRLYAERYAQWLPPFPYTSGG